MKSKKWSIILICCILISVILFGGLNYLLDPMCRYRNEEDSYFLTSYEYAEMYANPGIARNYDYDSVMVGTSMIENTDVDLCDELWNVDMVRLPYSGGTSLNMKTVLEVCFENNDDIKNVYWELDEFQLFGSSTETRYPLPDYLYNQNHKDDLKYLLNLDIFYHYTLKDVINTLRGSMQTLERRGITLTGDFGKENMLSTYFRLPESETKVIYEESSMPEKIRGNLDNIETLVEAHPETHFTFFMPPFSVLYWDNEVQNGTFDATLDGVIYALDELLQYDNVTIYYYQAEEDIISNLDNYKDYSHYGNWINDQLTAYMAEDYGKLDEVNCEIQINRLREYVYSYDYGSLFTD